MTLFYPLENTTELVVTYLERNEDKYKYDQSDFKLGFIGKYITGSLFSQLD